MEAKEKGVVLDAEAEAFLANVECTAHYDDSLAITTTTSFEVSHEDAYDFDVDEAPHVAATFMAKLTGTSTREGTSNETDFHSEEEQLDSDVNSDIDDYDNIITYHQYQSNTKVENVPTEVSPVLSDQIFMITILDYMRLKLEGYMNTNKEQSLANDSLKTKLERYKTQVQNLEQCKVKRDLEQLVTKRNKQNDDLEEQIMSLKQQLSQQVGSNKSLKTKSNKLKTDNKAREDSYQEELVWLRHANKVVIELLKSYGKPIQTIPMLSKRPTFASKDLHKTALGRSNPKVHDNKDTLVHAKVSRSIEENLFKEVSEYMKIFEELNKEYDQYICSVVLTPNNVAPISVEPCSNCDKEQTRNLKLEAEISKVKQLLVDKERRCSHIETEYLNLELKSQKYKECFENPLVCNNLNSPELNIFFEINKLKEQLQEKDNIIGKLKAHINNMKDVSTGPSLSTLKIENTQLKEELTAIRIKNDSLRDENVSIKARRNSSVSSGATIHVKPKAVAYGLYAMTPNYVPPQKRINMETNYSLPRKETVTVANLSNVPVNLPTRIKSVRTLTNPSLRVIRRSIRTCQLEVRMNNKASNNSDVQNMEEQHNGRCNLFNNTTHEAPVYRIRIFEMIKYSFGQDEEYVAVKECDYDDLRRTNKDACQAYQEIFRSMDEGWVVIRAE
nr:hypothetical protein [Tanacetum cinerariifolium]